MRGTDGKTIKKTKNFSFCRKTICQKNLNNLHLPWIAGSCPIAPYRDHPVDSSPSQSRGCRSPCLRSTWLLGGSWQGRNTAICKSKEDGKKLCRSVGRRRSGGSSWGWSQSRRTRSTSSGEERSLEVYLIVDADWFLGNLGVHQILLLQYTHSECCTVSRVCGIGYPRVCRLLFSVC